MKLKYYLRGIAVGILFTVAVMGLTGANKKQAMSDSEIIHAAKNLGMVEGQNSVTITGIAPTPTPDANATVTPSVEPTVTPVPTVEVTNTPTPAIEPTSTPTVEPTKAPTATPIPTPAATPIPTPTATPVPTATPEPTKVPVQESKPTDAPGPTETPEEPGTTVDKEDTVTLSIVKGMYSEAIAQAAYQLGLVTDAKDFNKYLIDNDFASNIHIGTYKIKKDATYYEIAKAITTRKW